MKKVSIFKVIGCFALALCTSLCAVLAVGCSGNKDEKTADGGLVVTPGDQNEMISLLAGPTKDSSGNFLSEYTLTVQFNDDCPEDMKLIDWSFDWKDPNAEWALRQNVDDYVSLTPTSDGSVTAKIKKIAAFGEQIIVTATARVATNLKATATVDCLKSDPVAVVSGLTFGQEFSKPDITFKTVGTIEPTLSGGEVYLKHCSGNFVYQFLPDRSSVLSDLVSISNLLGSDNEYRCWFGYKVAKQGNIPIYMAGNVLDSSAISVDDFFCINPNLSEDNKTEIKNSAAYKKAYNATLSYLTSKDSVTFSVHVVLTYNSVAIMDSYIDFSCKVNKGNATSYDIVTSVAFTDSAIIF